ncbi:MAG: cyclodeaminase/cyclohydrolase family protein [Syntrophobacterales bacterium]|jgi:formiminotetrahydrofolate cyclodeaminase
MSPSFLDQLARARPDPGGGAAAAFSAGVGLALLTKVIRLEKSRPYNDESQVTFWTEKLAETRRLVRIFQRLRRADVEAYLTMAQALSVRQQGSNLQRAVEEATRCPWQVMGQVLVALDLIGEAGAHCRNHLLSDLLVATELLGGALQAAYHIAAANLPLINATIRQREWVNRLSQASHQGLEATLRVRSQLLAKAHAAINA